MGIEEAILNEVEEKGIEKGIEQGIEKGIEKGIERGIEKGITIKTIQGIQNLLKRGKYTQKEIAEDMNVSLDFVMKVKNGEIKNPS